MRLKAVLGVLGIAVLLSAAGCGSSGSTNTSAGGSTAATSGGEETGKTTGEGGASGATGEGKSGPLTKQEFIKQGDAICKKIPAAYTESVKKLEAEAKKKGQKPTLSETNLKAAVPPLYVAIEELEALTPPQGEEQKAEAIVKALESAAKGVEAKPESPLSGPGSPYAEFQKLTKEYGFKVCSQL